MTEDALTHDPDPQGSAIGKRLFRIGAIAAALSLLLFFVNILISDRSHSARVVQEQVAADWGGAQVVTGPRLLVPATRTELREIAGEERMVTTREYYSISPASLSVEAALDPSSRSRSLFEVIVYTARVGMKARFDLDLPELDEAGSADLEWDKARLLLSVSHPRGFSGEPVVKIGDKAANVMPGIPGTANAHGFISVPAGLSTKPDGPFAITADMTLRGTEKLSVVSSARDVQVAMTSPWPHPGFIGGPASTVSESGFTASWRATNLSTGGQLVARGINGDEARPVAGVNLIEPIDLYRQLSRAVKYGALFIALTFLVFLVFDLTGGHRLPMLGYGLVGLGLVQFFVMLLAFAEQLFFPVAYAIAAAALVLLVTLYARSVLRNGARAAIIGGVMTALYGGLFALLRLEDIALLLGSLVLFVALAMLMYITRNIGEAAPQPGAAA